MNIAMVVGTFPTPTETWIPDQVVGLLARGHRVRLFASPPVEHQSPHPIVVQHHLLDRVIYHPPRPAPRWARVPAQLARVALGLHMGPRALLASLDVRRHGYHAASGTITYPLLALLPALRRERFDIVHAHDALCGLAPALLKGLGRLNAPLLVTLHGPDINDPAIVRRSRGYPLLARHVDAFTAGSEYVKRRAERLGFAAGRIHVLPQSVRADDWSFLPRRPGPDGTVCLLCIGRLSPVKGVHLAIGAMAALARDHPHLRLILAGDGPLRSELEALAVSLGVADRVEFLGMLTRDRLLPVLERAHILVHPGVQFPDGFGEAQGMVLLEAQACGLPVVTTTAGGIPESVRDGESAIVVPHSDQQALTNAIDTLLRNPEHWPAMGRAGRELVESRFSLDHMIDQLEALYARLASAALSAVPNHSNP